MKGPRREALLLTDQSWGSAVQAARQLAKSGTKVFVANAGTGSEILASSRSVAAASDFDARIPEDYSKEVVRWAQDRMSLSGPVPVIPLSDRLLELLDRGRADFPFPFRLAIPPRSVVQALISKETSLTIAEQAGLQVPAGCTVRSQADLKGLDKVRLPVIVRPISWSEVGLRYFKIAVFREPDSLSRFLGQALSDGGSVLVQEYIEVPDGAVEFGLVWRSLDGARTEVCTGVKRRESSSDGGVMAWGETMDMPQVRDMAERFVKAADFVGTGGIEFIRQGDHHWFIEFNPRLEAIHFIGEAAGLPLVRYLDEDLRGLPVDRSSPQTSAAAWVGSAWIERLRRHPSDIGLYLRDRLEFATFPRRVSALWSLRDPMPSLHFLARLVTASVRSLRFRTLRPRGEK